MKIWKRSDGLTVAACVALAVPLVVAADKPVLAQESQDARPFNLGVVIVSVEGMPENLQITEDHIGAILPDVETFFALRTEGAMRIQSDITTLTVPPSSSEYLNETACDELRGSAPAFTEGFVPDGVVYLGPSIAPDGEDERGTCFRNENDWSAPYLPYEKFDPHAATSAESLRTAYGTYNGGTAAHLLSHVADLFHAANIVVDCADGSAKASDPDSWVGAVDTASRKVPHHLPTTTTTTPSTHTATL